MVKSFINCITDSLLSLHKIPDVELFEILMSVKVKAYPSKRGGPYYSLSLPPKLEESSKTTIIPSILGKYTLFNRTDETFYSFSEITKLEITYDELNSSGINFLKFCYESNHRDLIYSYPFVEHGKNFFILAL